MDVAFRVLLEVDEQLVGIYHRGIQVPIELRVVHEQSQGAFLAVEGFGHLVHVGKRLVHLIHRSSHIDAAQLTGEALGIGKHAVGLSHQLGQLSVQGGGELTELTGRRIQVDGDGLDVVQAVLQRRTCQDGLHILLL